MTKDPKAPISMTPDNANAGMSNNNKDETDPMKAARAMNGEVDEPTVDQGIQRHLGRKLKASYDDLIKQPVPDKFRQLLDDLERQEKKR